jgi:tRNA threonylcarbamoyladenosine biosynthesis protein TsaE
MERQERHYTLSELSEAAAWLLREAGSVRVFLFYGNLGAGKTTLIKTLCHQLFVEDQGSSPTYALVNEYDSSKWGKIYHMDLYRLKSGAEALDIGIEEYLDSGNYCFIEWPELIVPFLPKQFMRVELTNEGTELRKMTIFKIH